MATGTKTSNQLSEGFSSDFNVGLSNMPCLHRPS
jgi:hypothetical protein